MANPDSRYGETMAFLEGKKQHAFNLWADSGISTRAWKKYTAKIDNQILRIVNSLRLGKSDVVPFSAGILKTRGPDTRDRSGSKLRQFLNFQSVMSGYGRTRPRRDYTSTEARQEANLIYGVGGASTGANRTGDFAYLADQEEAQQKRKNDFFSALGELQKKHSDAFLSSNQSLGSWTSKRSKILSTMGDSLGEAFYEKVANLERSKHHWSSRISLGKISREYNVRSAIGSGMHGVHGTLGGIPGFRIHTERDAEDYLWFLNHKGEMTERGAYSAVKMNRSLKAQELRRTHSKNVRDRIKAGDEAYESDLADATGDDAWRQEKLIRSLAKTYSPDDLKKGQDRARNVLFARNHKALYKISKWLPSTSKGMMALGKHMDAMKAIGGGRFGGPVTAGITVASGVIKIIDKIFEAADSANAKVVSYENAAKTYGTGSRKFRYAAGLAGITDPRKQMELHGKLTEQFGDAESGIAALGEMLPSLSQKERLFFAKSLGLSPDELALIDIYNNTGKFKMSRSRMTNAKVGLAELSQTYMSSSDADNLTQFGTILFSKAPWAGRDISDSAFNEFLNTPNAVNKAAGSADYYEKTKGSDTNTGNTISQHFGDVHLHGVNNPTEFANSLASEGGIAGQALQNTNTSMVV